MIKEEKMCLYVLKYKHTKNIKIGISNNLGFRFLILDSYNSIDFDEVYIIENEKSIITKLEKYILTSINTDYIDDSYEKFNGFTEIRSDKYFIDVFIHMKKFFNSNNIDYEIKKYKDYITKFYNENKEYDILTDIDKPRTDINIEDFKNIDTEKLKYNGEVYVYPQGLEVPNLYVGKNHSWKGNNRNRYMYLHIFSLLSINPNIKFNELIKYSNKLMCQAFDKKWEFIILEEKIKHFHDNYNQGLYGKNYNLTRKYTFYSKDCVFDMHERCSVSIEHSREVRKNLYEERINEIIAYINETKDEVITKTLVSNEFLGIKKLGRWKTFNYWTENNTTYMERCNMDKFGVTSSCLITKKLKHLLDCSLEIKKSDKKFTKAELVRQSKATPRTVRKYWDDIITILQNYK